MKCGRVGVLNRLIGCHNFVEDKTTLSGRYLVWRGTVHVLRYRDVSQTVPMKNAIQVPSTPVYNNGSSPPPVPASSHISLNFCFFDCLGIFSYLNVLCHIHTFFRSGCCKVPAEATHNLHQIRYPSIDGSSKRLTSLLRTSLATSRATERPIHHRCQEAKYTGICRYI